MPKWLAVFGWIAFLLAFSLAVAPGNQWPLLRSGLKILLAVFAVMTIATLVYRGFREKLSGKIWKNATFIVLVLVVIAVFGGVGLLYEGLPAIAQSVVAVIFGIISILLSIQAFKRTPGPPQSDAWEKEDPVNVSDWIFRGVWIVFVLSVGFAVYLGDIESLGIAGAIILFGTLTLYFALHTIGMLFNGHQFLFESSWGGLGGGLGGWRISRPIVFLFLALLFSGITTALILSPMLKNGSEQIQPHENGQGNTQGTAPKTVKTDEGMAVSTAGKNTADPEASDDR